MLLFSCLYPIKLRIFKYLLLSCIFLFSIVQGMYCKGYVMIHTMFAFISIFFVCVISKLTLRYYAYLFLKDTYFQVFYFHFFFLLHVIYSRKMLNFRGFSILNKYYFVKRISRQIYLHGQPLQTVTFIYKFHVLQNFHDKFFSEVSLQGGAPVV